MTPQDALTIIDNTLSQINADRAGHMKLQTAVQTLHEALKPVEGENSKPSKKAEADGNA